MLRPETEIVVSKGPFPSHILLGLFLRCLPVTALTGKPPQIVYTGVALQPGSRRKTYWPHVNEFKQTYWFTNDNKDSQNGGDFNEEINRLSVGVQYGS